MSTTTRYDGWVVSRVMADLPVEGKLEAMTPALRELAMRLQQYAVVERRQVLDGYATAQAEPDKFLQSIVGVPPGAPEPEREPKPRGATLADVCRLDGDRTWPWPGWLPRGALTALASDPGIGKTVLALTLSRNLWEGRGWPDGQGATFPPETKTLWVPGDQHFGQLVEVVKAYGLPPEAILLNGLADEPTGRMFLDDADAIEALRDRVAEESPALVVIDTVGMTTDLSLSKAEEARRYFDPLMKIANKYGTTFMLMTHLSKDTQQALGRRIVGASRVVWKLTQPDPEGQPHRRKLWVDKSYAIKPPALGMTIAADGCTFDATPPDEPPPQRKASKPRPAPARLEECKLWLVEHLTSTPIRVKDIRTDAEKAGYDAKLLYRAYEALGGEEYLVDNRKWWRMPVPS